MSIRRRAALGAASALAFAVVLTACSSDDESGTTAGGAADDATDGGATTEELIPVSVGVLPVLPVQALQVGIDEGIFAEHGFEVTLESGQGGAALVPSILSGEINVGLSNPLALMIAKDQGFDLELLAGFAQTMPAGQDDIVGISALADSGIESAIDLENATIAVNTLNSQGDITAREAVRAAGGDPSTIEFIELGFSEMQPALERGDVDAVWTPEPYLTRLQDSGAHLVTYNLQEVHPEMATMSLFTSGEFAAENGDLVEDFTAAWAEVLEFAQENQDMVRASAVANLELDPELAERVGIETFTATMNSEATQRIADLAFEEGLISDPVDLDAFIPES